MTNADPTVDQCGYSKTFSFMFMTNEVQLHKHQIILINH